MSAPFRLPAAQTYQVAMGRRGAAVARVHPAEAGRGIAAAIRALPVKDTDNE